MVNKRLGIVVISPYLPALDTVACARKVYDCIRLLKQRGHNVYLLSFCSEKDKERINHIRKFCAQLHLEYLKSYSCYPGRLASLTRKIEHVLSNEPVDILQSENSYLCRYLPGKLKVPSILVEHELLSESFKERAALEHNFINKIMLYARAAKKIREQARWYSKFDKIVVFTEEDKALMQRLYGDTAAVKVIPLGISVAAYSPPQSAKEPYDIIFTGNFSHLPNVDAVKYFYKEIFPLIVKQRPDTSFIIAGDNPAVDIRRLPEMNKNVFVPGYTRDFSENYAKGRVFIAPIRYGTGMRYKILEAMTLQLPVVSTSIAARGLPASGGITIADTKNSFADAVVGLLNDPDKRLRLAREGHAAVERLFDWETLLDKYEDMYYGLTDGSVA